MKKVRFETPKKIIFNRMNDSECHSPRPFLERQASAQAPDIFERQRVVYSSDPVHRFENSDCSPYPLAKKTELSTVPEVNDRSPNFLPSSDLNLSMLDIHEPRPQSCNPCFKFPENRFEASERTRPKSNILSAVENTVTPPNVLVKDDNFFIKRDNLKKYGFGNNSLQQQLNGLTLYEENNPVMKKAEIARSITLSIGKENIQNKCYPQKMASVSSNSSECNCHHCSRVQLPSCVAHSENLPQENILSKPQPVLASHPCKPHIITCYSCEQHAPKVQTVCNCTPQFPSPLNAIDKKTWAIQKLEQSKKADCMEIEKQTNVTKEKREPTISDLLKIIKLQNEQLQLLQEKVDKFITASANQPKIQTVPVQNYVTEHVALQTMDSGHKISIGVMTSFEMVRTSTVINKEVVHTNENAQIQCNRSHVSIKEVVSKQPVRNFLDGITPVSKSGNSDLNSDLNTSQQENGPVARNAMYPQTMNEEKTLNELSLYNVQVDNATTPLMSPEQSLYLDVRDYSDSESTSSDDHSNVGWTYYNKVMTHVNGMLQDSDMPSSASALYRNTRQQCVHIDKTNVSVTKRVKFGDDPLGINQPHIYASATDTSLKMNQLATKYLKTVPAPHRAAKPANAPVDMSFATRKYMERHRLLQGIQSSKSPPPEGMPRFLDITALKKQPKLL